MYVDDQLIDQIKSSKNNSKNEMGLLRTDDRVLLLYDINSLIITHSSNSPALHKEIKDLLDRLRWSLNSSYSFRLLSKNPRN